MTFITLMPYRSAIDKNREQLRNCLSAASTLQLAHNLFDLDTGITGPNSQLDLAHSL